MSESEHRRHILDVSIAGSSRRRPRRAIVASVLLTVALLLATAGCKGSGLANGSVAAPGIPFPHTTVDPSTMTGKLLMGYQGWFGCPSDGSQLNDWVHWFKAQPADAANIRVDMWPETAELSPADRCPTQMSLPNAAPAYLYSAYNPNTVKLHFHWMYQYGIDGVMLQRFTSGLGNPIFEDRDNRVTQNVMDAAQSFGRVFNIMYDVSGDQGANFVSRIEADWKHLVDVLKVTSNPQYLHQNGKPVLSIWGLGFKDHPGTPAQAMQLVQFFENNPDPQYRVTLMGGVPTFWRSLTNDSQPDAGFANYYCSLNVISPWTVGRYKSDVEVDQYAGQMVVPDIAKAKQCGAAYMPVVWPGSSFHNASGTPLNDFPRRGGRFYWRQVYDFISAGATMIYNAMFDEVDEGTAMYKTAPTVAGQPVGANFVSLDADGESIPSDWYLKLAGKATRMLRKSDPLSVNMPLTPVPAAGSYLIQISLSTTSDWTVFQLLQGADLLPVQVVSYSPTATNAGWSGNELDLGQPLNDAGANSVKFVVTAYLRNVVGGSNLQFRIERGGIGSTEADLSVFVNGNPVAVATEQWAGTGTGALNPHDFSVPPQLFGIP